MSAVEQVGVVTGASSGIGRATALALAHRGMVLGLVGRDSKRLADVAAAARSSSPRVEAYQGDLRLDEDLHRVAMNMQKDFAGVDVLVHSAGLFHMGAVSESPVEELDELYRVNVRAPYALSQALLPLLRARSGQIVFVNSSLGLNSRAGVAGYAATKHALKAIADALRAEVNPDGVRVISIYPGRTATPQQRIIHEKEGKPYRAEYLLQPEDVARALLDSLLLPRTAEVTDINIRPMHKS